MSQLIRYVHIEDTEMTVEEFIDFIQLNGKPANKITEQMFDKF